jgi:hypothetical protein
MIDKIIIAVSFVGIVTSIFFIWLFHHVILHDFTRDSTASEFLLALGTGFCLLCSMACSVIVFLAATGLLS